ncbi:hypothetical protein H0A61_01240 [Koleobacter methoxysyntrophicus]|jgi:hypothetical protein|uniref:Uncharacterized protein n=1 Tax=Koleobacter methoxysyntrophicus TaxID=2751313 RepID=A0A8A0RMZ2_9FIRM|nr:hypothetical protein [Koleobacter methoxysyntrophicus]NPV44717.1 hypothetical protein [Bacillota bacterium]QSQ08889.1 hypothetical protein H0A61_01240 [Koleobacter methoxysyntrophicus]
MKGFDLEKTGWLGLPLKTWLIVIIPFILTSLAPWFVAIIINKRRAKESDFHE